MDGKVLLLGFVAIVGGIFLLKGETIKLPNAGFGGGLAPATSSIASHKQIGDRSDPNSYVRSQLGMDKAQGPIAATEHLTAAFIGKVLSPVPSSLPAIPPAQVRQVAPHPSCTFSAPAKGSRVAYISSSSSATDSPVFVFGDADVRKTTQRLLKTYRSTGEAYVKIAQADRRMEVYDVAVSETDFPVHLVLHSSYKIIWNLHLAPDARVSGVSILGGEAAGVAGVDASVPVEIMTKEQLKACKIGVQNYSLVNPVFVSSVEAGVISTEEAKETQSKWQMAMERYETWFRGQFGVRPRDIVIGYMHSAVGLIGPLPEGEQDLVPYTPFSEKELVLAMPERMFIGSYADFKKAFKDEVLAMAQEVTGGDFDILKVREN